MFCSMMDRGKYLEGNYREFLEYLYFFIDLSCFGFRNFIHLIDTRICFVSQIIYKIYNIFAKKKNIFFR